MPRYLISGTLIEVETENGQPVSICGTELQNFSTESLDWKYRVGEEWVVPAPEQAGQLVEIYGTFSELNERKELILETLGKLKSLRRELFDHEQDFRDKQQKQRNHVNNLATAKLDRQLAVA